MDQDNRQGGFDPSNGAGPGQQAFFFNPQQQQAAAQQQFFQNQLLQQQVAQNPQIGQTPQMLPAQRPGFPLQGQQPLFQQAQAQAQLPGSGQFAGAQEGFQVAGMRPDLAAAAGVPATAPNAAQLGLLGLGQGYGGQDPMALQKVQQQAQQQQALQQQMQQRQSLGVALGGDAAAAAFLQQQTSAGASGAAGQQTPSGQASIQNQYQQAILAMQKQQQNQVGAPGQGAKPPQDMLLQHQGQPQAHQSIPQTPSQSAFKLPQHIMDPNHLPPQPQQTPSQQPRQPPQQQAQSQVPGSAAVGSQQPGQQSQNQPQGGQPQTNLAISFQQQLANVQAQQQNAQGPSITSQLLNQFLTTQQQNQQVLSQAPHQSVFSKMKASGQWPQHPGFTTNTPGAAGTASATQGQQSQGQPQGANQQAAPGQGAVNPSQQQNNQGRQNEQSHQQQMQPPQSAPSLNQPGQQQLQQNAGSNSIPQAQMDDTRQQQLGMWQMQQNPSAQAQQAQNPQQLDDRQQQQPNQQSQTNNQQTSNSQQNNASQYGSAQQQFMGQQQQQNFASAQGQQPQQNSFNRLEHLKQEQSVQQQPQSQYQQQPQSQSQHGQMFGNQTQASNPSEIGAQTQGQSQQLQQQPQAQPQSMQQQNQQPQQFNSNQPQQPQTQKPAGNANDQMYQAFQQQTGFPPNSAQAQGSSGQNQQSQHPQHLGQNQTQAQPAKTPPHQTPQQQPEQQFSVAGMNQAQAAAMGMRNSREQTHQASQEPKNTSQHAMMNQLGQGLFMQQQKDQSAQQQFNQQSQQPGATDAFNQYQQQLAQQQQIKNGGAAQPASIMPPTSQHMPPNSQHLQQNSQLNQIQQQMLQQQNALQQVQHPSQPAGGQGPQQMPGQQQHLGGNSNLLLQMGINPENRGPQGMTNINKQEPVNQQHLLAAISSIQTPHQGALQGVKPPNLAVPGQQNPMEFFQSNQNEIKNQLNMLTGQQVPDQNQAGVMGQQPGRDMIQFMQNNQVPGGAPHAANVQNILDPNLMQIQQQQQQMTDQNWNIQSIPSLSKMAEFCATRGDYQQAIEYYRQLITHDPNNGASWTALGHCYLLTEDIHKAFTAYQHALYSVEDMNDPQLWYGIGILYERFESYDNAISALIGVLKMSPNFYQKSEVLYKLGTIFAKTNQIDQACKFFQNSILTSSFSVKKKVDTLIKIGLLNEEKKDFQQAKRSFEAALSLNDKNVRVYQHLAWCSFRHGNIEQALRYIQKAEKRSKDNVYSLYIKGRCLICLDNTQEAFESLSQAAQQLPSEAVFWTSLAVLLYNQGKINESFENITQATTLKHELWEVWYNLGILYETCKQPEEALIAYDMVLSIDPKQPDAQKRILAIKQPKYNEEMNDAQNPVQLQMKHPSYCIPNTLTILRNYWKHHENKQTTLQPVQPPQNSALQMQNGDHLAANPPFGVSQQLGGLPQGMIQSHQQNPIDQGQPQPQAQPSNLLGQQRLDMLDNAGSANDPNQQQQSQMNMGQQMLLQQQIQQKQGPSETNPDPQQHSEQQANDPNQQQQNQMRQMQNQLQHGNQGAQQNQTPQQQINAQPQQTQPPNVYQQESQVSEKPEFAFKFPMNQAEDEGAQAQPMQQPQQQRQSQFQAAAAAGPQNNGAMPPQMNDMAQKDTNVNELFSQFQKQYHDSNKDSGVQQQDQASASQNQLQQQQIKPPQAQSNSGQDSQQQQQPQQIEQNPSAMAAPFQDQQQQMQAAFMQQQMQQQKQNTQKQPQRAEGPPSQVKPLQVQQLQQPQEQKLPQLFNSAHQQQQQINMAQQNLQQQADPQQQQFNNQMAAQQQNLQQQPMGGDLQSIMPLSSNQMLEGGAPAAQGKDDETEREESSDDQQQQQLLIQQQQQLDTAQPNGNYQAMNVLGNIPISNVGVDQPRINNQQQQPSQPQQQPPLEINVESVPAQQPQHHEQFRQGPPLGFQSQQIGIANMPPAATQALEMSGYNQQTSGSAAQLGLHGGQQVSNELPQNPMMASNAGVPLPKTDENLMDKFQGYGDISLEGLAAPFKKSSSNDDAAAIGKKDSEQEKQQPQQQYSAAAGDAQAFPAQKPPQMDQQQAQPSPINDNLQPVMYPQQNQADPGSQNILSMLPPKQSSAGGQQFPNQDQINPEMAQNQQAQVTPSQQPQQQFQQQQMQQPQQQQFNNAQGQPQQQQQIPPLLRKMPFIAQTQLGFAPMKHDQNGQDPSAQGMQQMGADAQQQPQQQQQQQPQHQVQQQQNVIPQQNHDAAPGNGDGQGM